MDGGNHQSAPLGSYVISGGSAHEQVKTTSKFSAQLGREGRVWNDVSKLQRTALARSAQNLRSRVFDSLIIYLSVKKSSAVRYRAHNCLPLLPTLSHINPLNTVPSCFTSILILPSNTRLGLSDTGFPSGFSTKFLPAFSSMRVLFPEHFVLLCNPNTIWRGINPIYLITLFS